MRVAMGLLMTALVACSGKSSDTGASAGDEGTGDEGTGDDGTGGDSGSGDDSAGDDGGGSGDDSGSGDDGGDDGGSDDGGADDGGADDGGAEGGAEDGAETLEIAGNFLDNYGYEHVITETSWEMDFGSGEIYTYSITLYDNATGWLVTENGADTGEEAGYWSRFDWAWSGTDLYVCQTEAFAASEGDALGTTPANAGDLEGGCPGYGWLLLTAI